MTENQPLDVRGFVFKYRSYTPIPFLVAMVAFAQPSIQTLLVGGCVAILGELIRFWGVAIAGSETRTTGDVGGTYLITNGPFAFVRNPLYVGNILLYAGAAVMSNALFPWLLIITIVWFYVQYTLIVSKEEEYLAQRFGDAYADYAAKVGRFFPRITPYVGLRPPEKNFNLAEGFQSERRTLQAIGIITLLIVLRYATRGEGL